MTLANCKKLLEHYNKIIDGTIIESRNKNWPDVIANSKMRAEEIEERIERKSTPEFREKLIKMGKVLPTPEKPKPVKKTMKKKVED